MNDFTTAFSNHHAKFKSGVLSDLWHVLERYEDRSEGTAAFTVCLVGDKYILGVCDQGQKGYTNTNLEFIATSYEDCRKMVAELNKDFFGLDALQAAKIVASTL
jgi:hypothetical protein